MQTTIEKHEPVQVPIEKHEPVQVSIETHEPAPTPVKEEVATEVVAAPIILVT